MNWTILNVSIPVHDLDKSKEFYEMLLGITEDQEELYQPLFQNEKSIFLGDKGFGFIGLLPSIWKPYSAAPKGIPVSEAAGLMKILSKSFG